MDNTNKLKELKEELANLEAEYAKEAESYYSYLGQKAMGVPAFYVDMWINSAKNCMEAYGQRFEETKNKIKELEGTKYLYESEIKDAYKYELVNYKYTYKVCGYCEAGDVKVTTFLSLKYANRRRAWTVLNPDKPYDREGVNLCDKDEGYLESQGFWLEENLNEVKPIIKSKLDEQYKQYHRHVQQKSEERLKEILTEG